MFNFKKLKKKRELKEKQKTCIHVYEIQDVESYVGDYSMSHYYTLICKNCEQGRYVEEFELNKLEKVGLIIKRI